jgi:hypothetical protein
MAKKSRATFQKREKERARQQKQHEKAQRRLASKEQRASSAPGITGAELEIAGMHPGTYALPEPWDGAPPTD